MIMDQQGVIVLEGAIDFPDYAFAALPLPPSAIKDTNRIQGGNSTAQAIPGNVNMINISAGQPPFPGS